MQIEENELERALQRTVKEPAHRPECYRILLQSTVFLQGPPGRTAKVYTTLAASDNIQIKSWRNDDGLSVIPFFSSPEALQQVCEHEASIMAVPAKALFEITRGAYMLLNPRLSTEKVFPPHEIETLLLDNVDWLTTLNVAESSSKILLGPPKDPPAAMLESLIRFFSQHGHVIAAYLALVHNPSQDKKPHLIVGIEIEDDVKGEYDFDQLFREIATVIQHTLPKDEPINMVRVVRGNGGLGQDFVDKVKPFYERTWGSKFQAFLDSGHA